MRYGMIGRLLIAGMVAAGALAVFVLPPSSGWTMMLVIGFGLGGLVGVALYRLCRGRPVWAGVGLTLLTLAVIGLIVVVDSSAPVLVTVPVIVTFVALVVAPPSLACGLALGGMLGVIRAGWRRRLAAAILVGAPALGLSAVAFNWPFYLMFWWARPGLVELAERAEAGATVRVPARVGLFTIEGILVDPSRTGNVILLTHTKGNSPAGFVRLMDPTGYARFRLRINPSNLDFPLDSVWRYQDQN